MPQQNSALPSGSSDQNPHLLLCSDLILSRCLSNAEVSTALRPFFFLVHPDLFGKHASSSSIGLYNKCPGKYPNEQSENEVNLKTLKNYVDMIAEGKKRPNPSDVRFFVRPKVVLRNESLWLKFSI